MALVIVLSTVVLLTILILSFFSKAQLNQQISFSGTNQIEADILARSCADLVVGEIREEIRAGSNASNSGTSSYPLVYEPTSGTTGVMARSGVSGGDTVGILTIRKVSADSAAINPYTGGRVLGSAASTSAASKNGRKWTASRWFTGSSSPSLGSASKVPDWVLLSSQNGVVVNPPITEARTPSNSNFVIGRFAYTVYDMDGLLDANLAGYASTLGTASGYKTSAAYADLTALGLSQSAIDTFVNWRNQVTGTDAATFQEWATGLKRPATDGNASILALNSVKSGYSSIALGDNAILSRRDLLNNPNVSSAANYLTHFARQNNGVTNMTVTSGTVSTANPKLDDLRFATSGTATHYGDDGMTVSYTVTAGDPLLQRRFSLARLAWVTPSGPSALLAASDSQYNAGGTKEAIQACFGLLWDETNGRWSYVGASGNSVQTSIKPLATVAGELREPNFFELLKAGIAEGSLGQYGNNLWSNTAQKTLQQSKDLQVIKIGANIINCAATDNYPRIIYFAPGGTGVESAGVANLPYLQGVDTILLSQIGSGKLNKADLIWTPILFNPSATGNANASGPGSINVAILSGTVKGIVVLGCANTELGAANSAASSDLSVSLAGQSFSVPMSQFSRFSQRPNGASNAGDGQSLGTLVPYATAQTDILCFRMFSYEHDSPGTLPATYQSSGFNGRTYFSPLVIALQYVTPGGKTKTYMTLGAYDDGTGKGPAPWGGSDSTKRTPKIKDSLQVDCNVGTNSSLSQAVFNNLIDPRSVRLGISQGWSAASTASTINPITCALQYKLPFGWGGYSYIYPAKWPQGDKTYTAPLLPTPSISGTYTNMTDIDGMARPADGWLGDDTNPYRDLTDTSRRPVILNRPFRSVAELGYVFRDSPWKTLSFFDDTSADGALLDLFSVADEPAIGRGKMNQSLAPTAVLNAVFKGAGQDSAGASSLSSPDALASAFSTYAMDSFGNPTASVPSNVSALPSFLASLNSNSAAGLDHIKYHREAVIRSLVGSSQTRTWNLLIDVVAQTGRYPSSASSLADFTVDGEKRYWLSVSIDRYTGKIIDRQLEPAWE